MTTTANGMRRISDLLPGKRLVLPRWTSALVLGFAIGAGVTYGFFNLWGSYVPPVTPLGGAGVAEGQQPFPLEAAGWLNGEAPSWADYSGKVVVLDVWADW